MTTTTPPTILQFGDDKLMILPIVAGGTDAVGLNPRVPVVRKFRNAYSRASLRQMTTADTTCLAGIRRPEPHLTNGYVDSAEFQPILYKLSVVTHFGKLANVPAVDVAWEQKKPLAVFRGVLSGRYNFGSTDDELMAMNTSDRCNAIPRCRLVLSTAQSPVVNAQLVHFLNDQASIIPDNINGTRIYGDRFDLKNMLQHKALIMLEGNSLSAGLKWGLYSNSVVMMPHPTMTSWAMEELLEPYVHYVPLADDLSDVATQTQWILDHDAEASQIARRGQLWMHDLLFHEDAESDDQKIFDEIIRRYPTHFVADPNL